MTLKNYLDRPVTRVRRKDRVLDADQWIDRLLCTAAVGHLAICYDGEPVLHSNLYWFDGSNVYWHTAPTGRLRAMLDTHPTRACFEVMEHGRMLPAETPFDFSTEYASVLVRGTVELVVDPAEKSRALKGIMEKYAPHLEAGRDYKPMPIEDVKATSVYRLKIESRVGKHNVKPAEYRAYAYPGESFIEAERQAGRFTMRAKELA